MQEELSRGEGGGVRWGAHRTESLTPDVPITGSWMKGEEGAEGRQRRARVKGRALICILTLVMRVNSSVKD